MKRYTLSGLADKFEKQAGAGEMVWVVLYVEANSDVMVQGVFSSDEKADAYLKAIAKARPNMALRLLVKAYTIDANPIPAEPSAPVAPGTPEPIASR